jgi:hypothetical protein
MLVSCLACSSLTSRIPQLVEPINQTSELDSIVPALSAFLLGICYEFDREPGEITRYRFLSFLVINKQETYLDCD